MNRREDRPCMTYKIQTSPTYHAAIAQGASEGKSKRRKEGRRLALGEGGREGGKEDERRGAAFVP